MRARSTLAALFTVGMTLILLAPAVASADGAQIERFMTTLEGDWNGRAVRTPVGDRPYDIVFRRSPSGALSGTADTGASLHHWRFFKRGQTIRLRFLSTFGGNDRPRWLTARRFTGNTAIFDADQRADLTVCVTPAPSATGIDIYLGGQPHVRIELARPSSE